MSIEAVFISFIFSLYAETTEAKSSAQINNESKAQQASSTQPQEVLEILQKLKIGDPQK
jgi:hypothetical protein